MVDPFTIVIQRLDAIGAFQFLLPYMIAAAVFYGLLRKSQIFGEAEKNVAVNAIVALAAAFMVSAYPILAGVNVKEQFSTFFFNATVAILTVVVGLMLAGLFFGPDLSKQISEKLGGGKMGIVILFGVLIGGGVLLSSGLINVFVPQNWFTGPNALSQDVIITVALLAVVAVTLIAIIVPFGGK